jgi:hypothetical protein
MVNTNVATGSVKKMMILMILRVWRISTQEIFHYHSHLVWCLNGLKVPCRCSNFRWIIPFEVSNHNKTKHMSTNYPNYISSMYIYILYIYIYITSTNYHNNHVVLSPQLMINHLPVFLFTCWWFQTCFIFHNIWDNPSHWLSYFSRWLLLHQSDYLISRWND